MSGLLCRTIALRVLSSMVLPVLLMHSAASFCQSGVQIGSITGKVKDAEGQTVKGATVTLSSVEDAGRLKTASTGADGTYRLVDILYGRYRISAAMPGHKQSEIELIDFAQGALRVDFTLQPVLLTNPAGGGFVGDDGNDKKPPSFQASPIAGSTAPSGYSAGASAEDAAVVMARVDRLEEGGLSLPAEPIPACNRERDLINAVHAEPRNFDTNHQLGVFYFGHGDIGKSIDYLKLASVIEPLDVNNARWLSLAYVRTGLLSKAIDLGQSLAKQRPRDAAPALLLGEIYSASGDRPKAVAQYLSAADLDASEANLFACGIGLVSLGDAERAAELFSAGTLHHPASAKLWMGLGIAQNLGDRKTEATRSLMRSADLDPNYLPVYLFLATLSGASSEMDAEIRKRLEVTVVSNPESAEAHYDYALALWRHARLDPSADLDAQIKAQLKLAIAKDPAFPAAHFKIGEIYQQAGDYAQATTELERAVQLDPSNATAHYRLSQAYRRNNQAALADLELAKFKKMRSAPPQEDDTAQEGVRVYTAQLARQPLAVSCHEGR